MIWKIENKLSVVSAVLLPLLFLYSIASAQQQQDSKAPDPEKSQDIERQVGVNKEAIETGASEDVRVDAAILLLTRPQPRARAAVLEILMNAQNPSARSAVIKALIKSTPSIDDMEDFIEPLIGILVDERGQTADLAAQALAVYDFAHVGKRLIALAQADELDRSIRLNALKALMLHPDKQSVKTVINLIDDQDSQLRFAAERALKQAFGYPDDIEKDVWENVLKDLSSRNKWEIMHKRLAAQLRRINELKAELKLWRKMYLAELEKEYNSADVEHKGKMLAEKLKSQYPAVKLWALGKVERLWSGAVVPTEKVGPVLLELISDSDYEVRLETARLLSKMSEINPAKELLSQLEQESYNKVKLELFTALGEAAYYAFSPGSKIQLDANIRDQTLRWAREYVNKGDTEQIKRGADVIRKLLELDGIDQERAVQTLKLLAQRYEKLKIEGCKDKLCGELLDAMARLCGGGAHCDQAKRLYHDIFLTELESDAIELRRAAVLGLINSDRSNALIVFRQQKLTQSADNVIGSMVVETAGMVGDQTDLVWLFDRLQKIDNGNGSQVFEAIKQILLRQDSKIILKWSSQLANNNERQLELLKAAESKAEKNKKKNILLETRKKITHIYQKLGDYLNMGRYYGLLADGISDENLKDKYKMMQIQAFIKGDHFEHVADACSDILKKDDINPQSKAFIALDEYMNTQGQPQTRLFKQLESVKQGQDKPAWLSYLDKWRKKLNPDKSAEKQTDQDNKPQASTPKD